MLMHEDKSQIEIRLLHKNERNLLKDIVSVHMETFKGFFLTFMGHGFLKQMYGCYCAHEKSGVYVAIKDGKVIGFLAFSANLSDLYKYMIKKRLVLFAWYSLCAFFRKPKIFMRLFRALRKPKESEKNEKYIELASIGVAPNAKREGVGTQLICRLVNDTDFTRYAYIALETDAKDNDAVNAFYHKNGFSCIRTYVTFEGREMNEYRRSE